MTTVAAVTRLIRRLIDAILLAIIAIVLVGIVFARVIPVITGGTTLVVGGPSMVPAIPVGAAIHAVPTAPERLSVGDVVSLRVGPDQAVFTHRLVRVVPRADGLWFESKGDANLDPDPALIPASAIIGRVEVTVPALGYLITLLAVPEGVMFLLGIAGSLLATVWLLETLELDQQTSLRRRRAILATARAGIDRDADGSAALVAGVGLAVGEPIARRMVDDAEVAPPSALPPPATPGAPADRRSRVGDRLASIRATRARRERWAAGQARASIWPEPVETVRVADAGSPAPVTRRRRSRTLGPGMASG